MHEAGDNTHSVFAHWNNYCMQSKASNVMHVLCIKPDVDLEINAHWTRFLAPQPICWVLCAFLAKRLYSNLTQESRNNDLRPL